MGMMLDVARTVVPRPVRRWLRQRPRRALFDQAMHEFARQTPARAGLSAPLVRQLIHGWANEKMSASEEYLQAIFVQAGESPGPILECGSGLSTLVLGVAARRSGQRVFTLEDDPFWASVVRAALARFDIDTVDVCAAPLRNHGDYEWYEPPRQRLPDDFALVICDGPQGTTPGGRYGLLPVLGPHLRSGCVILLDDAMRDGEQQVLARWDDELHVSHEVFGNVKPFARLLVPPAA